MCFFYTKNFNFYHTNFLTPKFFFLYNKLFLHQIFLDQNYWCKKTTNFGVIKNWCKKSKIFAVKKCNIFWCKKCKNFGVKISPSTFWNIFAPILNYDINFQVAFFSRNRKKKWLCLQVIKKISDFLTLSKIVSARLENIINFFNNIFNHFLSVWIFHDQAKCELKIYVVFLFRNSGITGNSAKEKKYLIPAKFSVLRPNYLRPFLYMDVFTSAFFWIYFGFLLVVKKRRLKSNFGRCKIFLEVTFWSK